MCKFYLINTFLIDQEKEKHNPDIFQSLRDTHRKDFIFQTVTRVKEVSELFPKQGWQVKCFLFGDSRGTKWLSKEQIHPQCGSSFLPYWFSFSRHYKWDTTFRGKFSRKENWLKWRGFPRKKCFYWDHNFLKKINE